MSEEKRKLLEQYRALRAKIDPKVLERLRKAVTGEKDKGPAYPGHAAVALFLERQQNPDFRDKLIEKVRDFDRQLGIEPKAGAAAQSVTNAVTNTVSPAAASDQPRTEATPAGTPGFLGREPPKRGSFSIIRKRR
jgi:hypothetical protein